MKARRVAAGSRGAPGANATPNAESEGAFALEFAPTEAVLTQRAIAMDLIGTVHSNTFIYNLCVSQSLKFKMILIMMIQRRTTMQCTGMRSEM